METTQQMPSALKTITERLNFPYLGPHRIGRFNTYLIDLSDWSLSLSDKTPCIWVKKADIETLSSSKLAASLMDVVREKRWQNNTILVFMDGSDDSLRVNLPPALPTFVSFNAEQQKVIQQADSPTVATLDFLLSQMSRSQLAPYETHKPVTGSQFFGRNYEINKVLQHPNSNYLFIGIRQIGKTSLLKEIKRKMDLIDPPRENQIRRLYVDCTVMSSELDFLRTLTVQLDPSELKLLMGRAAHSKRYQRLMFDRFADIHGGTVTFLVDELDRLLGCVSPNSDLFDVLRSASNAGKARFIMAGFRQAMQAATNLQSPFFDLVTEERLGRLKRAEVKDMVLRPMEQLRVTIKNREGVVNRINREAAGLPNYIQFYCKTLLEKLDERNGDTLTENDLQVVYGNHAFRDYVLDTFMTNSELLERALVYALVAEDDSPTSRRSFSQKTMDGVLKKLDLPFTYDQLDRTCRNLEVAGVFNQVGKNYEFALPLFKRMLRATRDVEFLFAKTREEILTAQGL